MPPTKLGHQPFYSDNPTSIPSSRMPKPSFRNYGKGLGLSTPISPREQVDQHTFRCSPPELPFTDSPLSGPLLWVHAEDPRPTPRLSLREARAWQETSREVEATSASTATRFKRLPTPLGSRSPEYGILKDSQSYGPRGVSTLCSRASRPPGTLGGNPLTGIDRTHIITVSNTYKLKQKGVKLFQGKA